MGLKLCKVGYILCLLCCINLLNNLNRGIIPGAPIQFQAFVQQTHNVSSSHVSVYIGMLSSSYIASYSVFVCIFGYLSITQKPFALAGLGLFIWVLAMVLNGFSKTLESFTALLTGCILSGAGESSFQAIAPPFIDEFAPENKHTFWLGIFYASIAVGQALGFSYSSAVASTIGWDMGFFITAVVMAPMAFACYKFIPDQYNKPLGQQKENNEVELLQLEENQETKPVSFFKESFKILTTPLFIITTLGFSVSTFTLSGLVTFAPAILIGYGL
ncbi:Major Facilitator Superfamily (MFS), partial [Thraustotheca clavata]